MENPKLEQCINYRVYMRVIHFSDQKSHKNGQNVLIIG